MRPLALILHATGTNRDHDALQALEEAGARAEVVHLNQLRSGERKLKDYQLLVIPGGFSYADALGAGKLLALDLICYFADEVQNFVRTRKPVIGICNGFQALVKAAILPGLMVGARETDAATSMQATLTFNAQGHFECRWIRLIPQSQKCIWTTGLSDNITCPVAHGEGNFYLLDSTADQLEINDQVTLRYAGTDGKPAGMSYPENPNGSIRDIAGICNPQGNVLGLMPHPENHIFPYQHPRWTRNETDGSGLPLFINGVKYASQLSG